MSCGLRGVFRTRSEVLDLEVVIVVLLLFVNVQINTVEVKQAMGQFVTSQSLHLHTFSFKSWMITLSFGIYCGH